MSHIGEIAAWVALAVAAVGGALVVLPRQTPEPVAIVLAVEPKPVERARPLTGKSEAERVDELQKALGEIASEHQRLTQEVKALVERQTEANSEAQGARRRK